MFTFDEKNLYPPRPSVGHFPPEKPHYTPVEEREHVTREMRSTIQRLLNFENRMKQEFDDLMKHITSDNVIFKETFSQAHTTFLNEVKSEVNEFESNLDNAMTMFRNEILSDYSSLSTSTAEEIQAFIVEVNKRVADHTENIQELYDSFISEINERIDNNNTTTSQAFQDYVQKSTTNINMFKADVNNRLTLFTDSINEAFDTFKTTWTNIVEERLNTQDSKLSDAEMYMKTNLVATITALIGDMHSAGDFVEIIEGEVLNHLDSKISHINALSFGAYNDGLTDTTTPLQSAIEWATENKVTLVMEGKFLISETLEITCDLNAENSEIIYSGERNCPAVRVKDKDHIIVKLGYIHDIDKAFHGWENDDYKGLELANLTHSKVSVRKIENFSVGLETKGQGSGFGWNTVEFLCLKNNRIQHHIVNSGAGAWHNANVFNGNDISWNSGEFTTADKQRYSIRQTAIDVEGISCNSNIFNNYYLECSDSSMKHIAISLVYATYWTFNGTRIEHAFSENNRFIVVDFSQCKDVATIGSHSHGCKMINTTYRSTGAKIYLENYGTTNVYCSIPEIIFVDFLHKLHPVYNKNVADLPIVELKDGFYFIERTTALKVSGATNIKDSVSPYFYCPDDSILSNPHRYLGTSNGTCFTVWAKVENGTTFKVSNSHPDGTMIVRCFNTNGEIIDRKKLITCGDYRENVQLYSVSRKEGAKKFSVIDEEVVYIAIAFESIGSVTIESDKDFTLCKWLPPIADFNDVCLNERFFSDVKPVNTSLPVGTTVATLTESFYLDSDKVWKEVE